MNKLYTPKKPAQQDWHVADIKAALEKAGWTLRRLSVRHGLAPTSLREALRRTWPNGERIIASAIGVAPETIWPSRYTESKIRRRSSFGSVQPQKRKAYRNQVGSSTHVHDTELNDTTAVKPCNVNTEEAA